MTDEFNRFEVFSAAVNIRSPRAVSAAVVQIKHTGDSIHANAVKVILLKPEHCRGNQERAHLRFCIVKHAGTPVLVFHFERVGIFILIGAVKFIQTVLILREVGGHPVDNDTDTVLVALVDEIHQIFRCAVAGGGGKVAGHLIAPGAVKRELKHRHHLNVVVAHVFDIGYQLIRQHAVGIIRAVFVLFPGTGVDFVDVNRLLIDVDAVAPVYPRLVLPIVAVKRIHLGGVCRCGFRMKSKGVCLHVGFTVLPGHGVFVCIPYLCVFDACFPNAAFTERIHDAFVAVPAVEVTAHADSCRMGSPDTKHSGTAFKMATEKIICSVIFAFIE